MDGPGVNMRTFPHLSSSWFITTLDKYKREEACREPTMEEEMGSGAMAGGLQRSAMSFRRQGSSGLVWEDRFLSGELNQIKKKEEQEQLQEGGELKAVVTIERSRSNGGRGYRTGKVSPALDPPSPKLSACGFCGVFGKPANGGRRPKSGKRKSR